MSSAEMSSAEMSSAERRSRPTATPAADGDTPTQAEWTAASDFAPGPVTSYDAVGLRVGSVADPAEIEAEQSSARIIGLLRRRSTGHGDPGMGRTQGTARAGHSAAPEVGRAGGALTPSTTSAIDRLRTSGRPLPQPVRRRLEDAFDTGLDDVRVHVGPNATALSRRLGATAFTVGRDIVLGEQHAESEADEDQRVLAHEVTHVLQNRGDTAVSRLRRNTRTDRDTGPVIRRLVGFEVELSVPTLNKAATTDLTTTKSGAPAPHSEIGAFFAGGLKYRTPIGAVKWPHGTDIAMTSDHNVLATRAETLFTAINKSTTGAFLADYTEVSNLEYSTPALDELAPGSDAVFKALAAAVDTHATKIFTGKPQTSMTEIPDAPGYVTGFPLAHMLAWLDSFASEESIKTAIAAMQEAITWDMYIQATVGVLPTGLSQLYESQAASIPVGDEGTTLAAIRDSANAVSNLSATFDNQPFFDTFNSATGNKLTVGDKLALRGVLTMAASYAVGNAFGQTSLLSSTQKNAVQLLSKLAPPGKVVGAMPSTLQDLAGRHNHPAVKALVTAAAAWIHTMRQADVEYWKAAPYKATVIRDRIYGKTQGLSALEATERLVTDLLTGSALAPALGPGPQGQLKKPDDAPAAIAGKAGGQSGIPMEMRWITERPSKSGELWNVVKSVLDQVRAANLAHVGEKTRTDILGRVRE